jgi:hypothetical protein
MSRPIFFIRRGDRLASRIKALFYGWRFARQIDGLVIMHWGDEMPEYWHHVDGTMYSASLIFDLQDFYAKGGSQQLVFMGERIGTAARRWEGQGLCLSGPEYAEMRYKKFSRDYFKKDGLVFYETQTMRYQFEDEKKTNQQVNREMGDLFKELPTTPYIQRVMDTVNRALGNAGYVGVHVRRGDVYDRMREELPGFAEGTIKPDRLSFIVSQYVTRSAPQALFEPFVASALAAGRKIAYFSDSPSSIDGFRRKFGGGNIVDMSKFKTRMPLQKAYLDFVMLKDSQQILSTRSNYASFGAELSGADHVIVSAADATSISPADVVELYYEEAIREFLPKAHLSQAQSLQLREEIFKAYARLNHLRAAADAVLADEQQAAGH